VTETILPPPPSYRPPDPETPLPSPPGRSDPSHATPNFHAVRTLARANGVVPAQGVCAEPARPEGRDAKGRFAHGNSGRPKGARSRLTTELDAY
jgi:hypothetical protein